MLTGEARFRVDRELAEVQRTLTRAQSSLESLDRNVTDPNASVQRNLEETLLDVQFELPSRRDQERIHQLTEYFLVGSFVSWLVALTSLALLAR